MNQAEFEKALGVGKNVVGRWERGTVPPTGAANLGLWVALHEPEVFAKWARTRGVEVAIPAPAPAVAVARTTQAPTATPSVLLFRVPGKAKHFSGAWPTVWRARATLIKWRSSLRETPGFRKSCLKACGSSIAMITSRFLRARK
ncbi:MAG: hypothetical protein IPK85_15260 [Gemmatimonadetes bacterium]|nr:hypothetical protein [Gemmatimonadota bacterium]